MHYLTPFAVAAALVVGCTAHTDSEPIDVGAASQALTTSTVFTYRSDEEATKVFVAPLAGVGYTVAIELRHHGDGPEGWAWRQRIVAFAVDHDLEPTGELFDTGYDQATPQNELVDAVPTLSAERTAIVTRERKAFGEDGDWTPDVFHRVHLFHPMEGVESSEELLTQPWSGRPEDADASQYRVHRACGRLAGDDFLLVAERQSLDAPDSYRSDLVALRVHTHRFRVIEQHELSSTGWIPLDPKLHWPDVQCTDAHFLEGGWQVVERRTPRHLYQHLLPATFVSGPAEWMIAYSPESVFRSFAVAGALRQDWERTMIVAESEDAEGRRSLASLVLRTPWVEGESDVWRQLGPSSGKPPFLAYDRHSMSEWYLLDVAPDTAKAFAPNESRLRRLGFDGYAYDHTALGGALDNLVVTHAHGVDQALLVFSDDATHRVSVATHAPRPRAYSTTGSTKYGSIGPAVDDGGSYLGTQPSTAMSGNDRFTVTAGGVRPDWDLELLVSDRLAYVDGTWVPDGSPDYSETFATRSDPAGAASLELPLGLHGPLGRFYTTGPGWPYFDEGGLVAGPSSLFFQWVWKEVTIDRWTWEPTVHIRRSQLLEVVPR